MSSPQAVHAQAPQPQYIDRVLIQNGYGRIINVRTQAIPLQRSRCWAFAAYGPLCILGPFASFGSGHVCI